jgi:NAD(P)-dependent dehydrogenase (short-subunit alcohol dehydrogenase family)
MPQRNWLITGVSSGFGRIMTEQLLARGDRVAGTVCNLSVMNDLKAEYGDRLWLAELDLSPWRLHLARMGRDGAGSV